MVVTIFGGDLKTGLIRVRNIPASAASCTVTLGAAGTISATVGLPMKSPTTGVVVPISSLLLPGKSFLGYEENGVILNAGPIWTDAYDIDKQRLTLSAAGLRSYWQFRFVLPALVQSGGNLPPGNDSTWSAMSLRTIMKRMVQQAQAWTNGSVPVVYEADFAGTAQRAYKGADLHVVDEKLKQISEVENGPDVMFNPRYTSAAKTHIEWVMVTGNPEITSISPHKWDMTGVPRPAVKGASITRDATVLTNQHYQSGAADPASVAGEALWAKASDSHLTGLGYPILESETDRSSVSVLTTLQEGANGEVIAGRNLEEQWKFQAKKNIAPRLGVYNVGDKAVLATKDDPRLGTGEHQLRIMEISTSKGNQFASITCAPKRVGV